MLFLKNQSIQFLKALGIKRLQDFSFLEIYYGFNNRQQKSVINTKMKK